MLAIILQTEAKREGTLWVRMGDYGIAECHPSIIQNWKAVVALRSITLRRKCLLTKQSQMISPETDSTPFRMPRKRSRAL